MTPLKQTHQNATSAFCTLSLCFDPRVSEFNNKFISIHLGQIETSAIFNKFRGIYFPPLLVQRRDLSFFFILSPQMFIYIYIYVLFQKSSDSHYSLIVFFFYKNLFFYNFFSIDFKFYHQKTKFINFNRDFSFFFCLKINQSCF